MTSLPRGLTVLLLSAAWVPTTQAAQLTSVRCGLQADHSVRVVLDLDARVDTPVVQQGGARDHVIRLPNVDRVRTSQIQNCATSLPISVGIDGSDEQTTQLRLSTADDRAVRVFALRPSQGRGHRIVMDLVKAPAALPPAESLQRMAAVDPVRSLPATAAGPTSTQSAQPASASAASPWQMRGYVGVEGRAFTQTAQFAGQRGSSLSLVAEPEFYRTWQDDSFVFRPYLRWDQYDNRRTAADVRELLWIHAGDGWELAGGIGKVFWGVTEAYHLVDVINQTDLIVNPDGEQKLGQPMLRGSLERDWGTVTLFALPGFRERTYPGTAGRFRPGLLVDEDAAQYRDGRGQWNWDWALRWSHYIGDFDFALSHFHGTGREPTLTPAMSGGQPVLVPVYELIDQSGLEAQLTRGDWLWKLEAMRRSGQGETFWATTGGFEYTLVGIANSAADLGLLGELMYDSRGDEATNPFNRDVFAGLRWTANDVDGTTLLTGLIRDWDNGATAFNLEASRRIGQRWTVQLQARGWFDVPRSDSLSAFARDDYAELSVLRYF